MSKTRLQKLKKRLDKMMVTSRKNPYDILTDDELNMVIKHLEAIVNEEEPDELPEELQAKLKWIEDHPITKRRHKALVIEMEELTEEEQDQKLQKLLDQLDIDE